MCITDRLPPGGRGVGGLGQEVLRPPADAQHGQQDRGGEQRHRHIAQGAPLVSRDALLASGHGPDGLKSWPSWPEVTALLA